MREKQTRVERGDVVNAFLWRGVKHRIILLVLGMLLWAAIVIAIWFAPKELVAEWPISRRPAMERYLHYGAGLILPPLILGALIASSLYGYRSTQRRLSKMPGKAGYKPLTEEILLEIAERGPTYHGTGWEEIRVLVAILVFLAASPFFGRAAGRALERRLCWCFSPLAAHIPGDLLSVAIPTLAVFCIVMWFYRHFKGWPDPLPEPTVCFNSEYMRVFTWKGELAWRLDWDQVERIGYCTTDAGPWFDDHFLVFKTKGDPALFYQVSLEWVGAYELSDYVDKLPDTRIPPDVGTLANCTQNKSVTIWPASKSGESMW